MDGEVLFQGISTEAGKKKAGYKKIEKCAQIAREHGIDYIWDDKCCLDKSSSAELSEVINSMARRYAKAAVCYAYIADIAFPVTNEGSQQFFEEIKQGAWFKKGWTLQELIFPRQLLFYAQYWDYITSRSQYAPSLRRRGLESIQKVARGNYTKVVRPFSSLLAVS
jgi:disulfide oxidoreductase YuzD